MVILQYLYHRVKYGSASRQFKDMERVARGSGDDTSEYVSLLFTVTSPPYICKRKDIEKTIDVPFECLMVPIPEEYDKFLVQRYGDYKTPVVEDIVATGKLWFLDTDHSYKDVVTRKGFYTDLIRDLSYDLHRRDWCNFLPSLKESVSLLWDKIIYEIKSHVG